MVLIKSLDDGIQFRDPPYLLFQLALCLLLFGHLCGQFVFHHPPHKFVLVVLDISHNPL